MWNCYHWRFVEGRYSSLRAKLGVMNVALGSVRERVLSMPFPTIIW